MRSKEELCTSELGCPTRGRKLSGLYSDSASRELSVSDKIVNPERILWRRMAARLPCLLTSV